MLAILLTTVLMGSPCSPEFPAFHAIAVPAPSPVPASAPDDREAIYRQGIPFEEFLAAAERRRARWLRNYENGSVDESQVERARAVGGTWRLLVVAVDGCSDSVSTIPYLAHLVNGAENLDMRIVDSDVGREVMLDHLTADGRAATPTVVLLNEAYEEVGCFIERPALLQAWVDENRSDLSDRQYLEQKFAWYDEDAGRQTVAAIINLMEAAAEGKEGC